MEFLKLLEGVRSPFLDTLVGLITRLGEETIGVVILCAIFWCISKRIGYMIGVAYFLSGLTVQGMKIYFRIPRPWVADASLNPVPSALEASTGYSFPSGHTQSGAAVFGSLGVLLKQKPVKALCFLAVILVAFSRLYLGVHTPLDVIASLVISFLFIFVTMIVIKNDELNKKRELVVAIVMALYSVAVVVVAAVLYNNGAIEEVFISDCLKAAGAGIGFAVGTYIERVYIRFSEKSKNIVMQIVKFIIGIAGLLAFKEGLKLIIGTGLVVDTIRYFLTILWIVLIFPLIIKRFFEYNKPGKEEVE